MTTAAGPKLAEGATYDLVIVGGGPAGASAAITAASAGVRVLLVERGRLPRQRVCGEFVSAESLDLLAGLLGNMSPALLQEAVGIPEARLFVDGHTVCVPVDPPGASIARFDLDAALWQAAAHAGVETRLQTSVESIAGARPFLVSTSAGELRALAVIDATGRWSNLSHKAKLTNSEPGQRWLGVKAHFSEESPRASVDLYFFEGGYCGVSPVRLASDHGNERRINVCAMVRADLARALPEVFMKHPQLAQRARHWEALTEPVGTSPLMFQRPRPTFNGMLRAGDAAGFVDPFVGDGISLALRSGAMAAECLTPFLKREISLREAAVRYSREYERRLLPVLRNSSKIRRLLRLPRPLRTSCLHLLENAPVVMRYLVRMTR
jgi:flavin-dependent dehydrogenase